MTERIVWRGIEIEVRHKENWLNTSLTHIEIEARPRTPLPVTVTGYRWHFIDPADLVDYEGVAEFVLFWLDTAGKDWDGQMATQKTRP